MNDTIPTMRGTELPSERLGHTLMHEHVFVLNTEIETNYPWEWEESERIQDAVEKLESAYDAGVRTIVDLTVIGLGRDVTRVRKVADQVRVNIVPATGLYTYDDVPMFFKFRGPGLLIDGPDRLVEFMVRDLTVGIADTGIRAGIIKCATDAQGVTPGVERVLRATARAHKETGAPISTHTHAGTERGLEQLHIFEQEGVDLTKVVIGHSGDTTDLNYLRRLLGRGVSLGMDRFGLDLMLSFEDRVDTVAALLSEGFADQIVLSHDASSYTQNFDIKAKERLMPNWHYEHVHRDVLPALQERGATPGQVEQMLTLNPARILG
ncbi:phosphotriesterase-related protein [Nocardioides salarius]|uniref:Phosphotriesterase-related protein n=1 Tax=Nocardioides salarius TaxID=374513 RepID=A0ABS2MA91_9ACTN|nr:phosphotriesterase-related protein [Nocardioides salarius]MBM7508067.1 phosphotriesterase-related protein [Nocardioides salarius]